MLASHREASIALFSRYGMSTNLRLAWNIAKCLWSCMPMIMYSTSAADVNEIGHFLNKDLLKRSSRFIASRIPLNISKFKFNS